MLSSFFNSIVSSMKGPRKVVPHSTVISMASEDGHVDMDDSSSSSSSSDSDSDEDDVAPPRVKPLPTNDGRGGPDSVIPRANPVPSKASATCKMESSTRSQSTISTASVRSADNSWNSPNESADAADDSLHHSFHSDSAVATEKSTGGLARNANNIQNVSGHSAFDALSVHKTASSAHRSPRARGAAVVTPTSANRPPRPQKTGTLSHIEDELIHHGHMVPLTKECAGLHMHVTVDVKTAQEIQEHLPLHTRHVQFTANGIKPNVMRPSTPPSLTPRRHTVPASPSHSGDHTVEALGPEGGHRILRSEVPDDLVDSIESLIDSQISHHGPHFAHQTIHSLISAAAIVHPK